MAFVHRQSCEGVKSELDLFAVPPSRRASTSIEIHFAAALAQTVNVVVYGESEAVLEIDKNRNIIYDH